MALHVGDEPKLVIENRKKVCSSLQLDFAALTCAEQVHGDKVAVVGKEEIGSGREDYDKNIAGADALVTDMAGVPLMLCYADCVPVVITDPARRVAAAVHAGWRGTVNNIVAKTLAVMKERFGSRGEDCLAAIGPSIGPCCYKVDSAVYDLGRSNLAGYEDFFTSIKTGEWSFDLQAANERQLLDGGLPPAGIAVSDICTSCNNELFFSHRAEQGKAGRFAALTWL